MNIESLIHCPSGHRYGVIDSRPLQLDGLETVIRKRKCHTCGHRTATIEVPELVAREVFAADD